MRSTRSAEVGGRALEKCACESSDRETVLTRMTCLTRSVCTKVQTRVHSPGGRMWACGARGVMRDCLHACVHCRCGSLKPHLVMPAWRRELHILHLMPRCKIHNSLAMLPVSPTLTRARIDASCTCACAGRRLKSLERYSTTSHPEPSGEPPFNGRNPYQPFGVSCG